MTTFYAPTFTTHAKQDKYDILRERIPDQFFAGYEYNTHKVLINYTCGRRGIQFYPIHMPKDSSEKPLFWRVNVAAPILFAVKKLFKTKAEWGDEVWFYIIKDYTVDDTPIVITTPSRMLPAVKYGMYTPPDIIIKGRLKGYDEETFNKQNMIAVRQERATVHKILVSAVQEIER